MTGLFRTDSAGTVHAPYIGEVAAAGLTPGELTAEIDTRLRTGNFIHDPHVAVNIEEADSLAYTIDGQVNELGAPTPRPPTSC